MALPLLEYKPTTQNHRVRSFGVAELNEDTPFIYQLEDTTSYPEMEALIRAAYLQVLGEHETLKFNRQVPLESQLKNRSIAVRDFIRGLAKSERFYSLVVELNNNYRLVEVCLKRLLGRAPYNRDEEIAWSIKIATLGWDGFVDALVDSEEYTQAFGDSIIPYQRKRMSGRPFNLVTPRYGKDYRESAGVTRYDWRFTSDKFAQRKYQEMQLREGDHRKFRSMAAAIAPKGGYPQNISTSDLNYLSRVPSRSGSR